MALEIEPLKVVGDLRCTDRTNRVFCLVAATNRIFLLESHGPRVELGVYCSAHTPSDEDATIRVGDQSIWQDPARWDKW